MLCYAMLCYAMLCYAMLCYAMLCYAMLCYAKLCYAMLCYAMLCCTVLYCTVLYCTVLYCIFPAQLCITLIILCIPVLHVISFLLYHQCYEHPCTALLTRYCFLTAVLQVNHMVPTVYQRLINAVHLLTEDLRVAGKESDVTAVWKPFIAEALALPAQHRH
jgi:hypothetical protein